MRFHLPLFQAIYVYFWQLMLIYAFYVKAISVPDVSSAKVSNPFVWKLQFRINTRNLSLQIFCLNSQSLVINSRSIYSPVAVQATEARALLVQVLLAHDQTSRRLWRRLHIFKNTFSLSIHVRRRFWSISKALDAQCKREPNSFLTRYFTSKFPSIV